MGMTWNEYKEGFSSFLIMLIVLFLLLCGNCCYAAESNPTQWKKPDIMKDGIPVSYQYVTSSYSEIPRGKTGVEAERTRYFGEQQASYLLNSDNGWTIGGQFWAEMLNADGFEFHYAKTTGFSFGLEDGDYQITVEFKNPEQNGYQVTVWDERSMQTKEIQVAPGSIVKQTFEVSVIDGNLKLFFLPKSEAKSAEEGYKQVYIDSISISTLPKRQKGSIPTLYIAGDSTAHSREKTVYPREGWGQEIYRYLDQGNLYHIKSIFSSDGMTPYTEYRMKSLIVQNWAYSGESVRSTWTKGCFDNILNQIKPGDYVLVQFGHNDNNPRILGGYVKPKQYKEYLILFAKGCQARGAKCVFLSSIPRCKFKNGKAVTTSPEHKAAMKSAAVEAGVPFVDTGKAVEDYISTLGKESALQYYMVLQPGQYANYPKGRTDTTHLNVKGAKKIAQIIAVTLKENKSVPAKIRHLITASSDYYNGINLYAKDVKINTIKSIQYGKKLKKNGKREKKISTQYKLTWKKQNKAKYYVIYKYVPSKKQYVRLITTRQNSYTFGKQWGKEQVKKMKVKAVLER